MSRWRGVSLDSGGKVTLSTVPSFSGIWAGTWHHQSCSSDSLPPRRGAETRCHDVPLLCPSIHPFIQCALLISPMSGTVPNTGMSMTWPLPSTGPQSGYKFSTLLLRLLPLIPPLASVCPSVKRLWIRQSLSAPPTWPSHNLNLPIPALFWARPPQPGQSWGMDLCWLPAPRTPI